jgi:hypothetical protein
MRKRSLRAHRGRITCVNILFSTQTARLIAQNVQPAYMLMLCSELGNESSPPHVRNAAGLALKNAVSARVSLDRHRPRSFDLLRNRTSHGNKTTQIDGSASRRLYETKLRNKLFMPLHLQIAESVKSLRSSWLPSLQ